MHTEGEKGFGGEVHLCLGCFEIVIFKVRPRMLMSCSTQEDDLIFPVILTHFCIFLPFNDRKPAQVGY